MDPSGGAAADTDRQWQDIRQWQDMGGGPAGPVRRDERPQEYWEKRVDALLVVLTGRRLFPVDALRRALEDLGEDAFERMSYYERWIAAIARLLVETGVLTPAEISRRMEQVRQRDAAAEAAAVERRG